MAAGVGRQEGGCRRDSFLVLTSGKELGSGQTQAPHQDIVLPAKACHLLPLLPPPKTGGAGPAAPPTSLREPRTLWMVPGAELEALTASRLRPITCAAVAGGPRSEGPRDHTGGGQEVDAGPAPQPSLGCIHALESAQGPPPAGPADGGSHCPTPSVPVAGSLSACRLASLTVFSPELGCFIYCLNTLF